MSAVEEIKARIDILSYVKPYCDPKKSGRYYKALCPFHSEKTPSFVVNEDTQTWRCFGACAEGGDIFAFAQKQHGWTFPEALRELGKLAGVEVKKESPKSKRIDHLLGIMNHVADSYHKLLTTWDGANHCLEYVKARQFTDDTIETWGLGYSPPGWETVTNKLTEIGYKREDLIAVGICNQSESGRVYDFFRNRFMIPIRDHRGRVVGFGARRLDETERAKYINSPQSDVFNKSQILFGLDQAKSIDDTLVVVEGYLDVIRAHQAGFTNVVGQLGTALTTEQINRMQRKGTRIVVALDGDGAGNAAAMHAGESLVALEGNILAAILPEGKDPDDVLGESHELWQTLIDQAIPIAEFYISGKCAHVDFNTPIAERDVIATELLPVLLRNESKIYRFDYLQRLSAHLRIPEGDLAGLGTPKSSPKQNFSAEHQSVPKSAAFERYVLLGAINHLSMITRTCREIDVPLFGPTDFAESEEAQVFCLITEAYAQFDMEPIDFVHRNIDPEIGVWDEMKNITPPDEAAQSRVIYYALKMRLIRLSREIGDLTDSGMLDYARELLQQKQRVAGKMRELYESI